jgi:hypothetical protein
MQELQLLQGWIDSPPQPLITAHINPWVRTQVEHHQVAQPQRLALAHVLIYPLVLLPDVPNLISGIRAHLIPTTLVIPEYPLDFVIVQVTT